MKKVILSAIVLGGIAMNANAQITIAPEVGVNLANASIDMPNGFMAAPDTKTLIGLRAGAVVNMPIYKGFFFQPGLMFSMKGFRIDQTTTVMGITATYNTKYKFNYLEVPLNLGYEYNFGKAGSVFATAGPYLGYALLGSYSSKVTAMGNVVSDVKEDMKFGSDITEYNPLDFGLNFGLGYKLPFGLYVRGQYGRGLKNMTNEDDGSLKNKVLSFSLGYAFKL